MCNGKILSAEFNHWIPFTDAVQHENGPFSEVPTGSGVYTLRVSKIGTPDLTRVKSDFLDSAFMKARSRMDKVSGELFAELGLGKEQAWTDTDYYVRRLARVDRIAMNRRGIACPIVYIGRANNLWRRMKELAFGGHTANAPFWALLMSGWKFDLGFHKARPKAEVHVEAHLKELFRELHEDNLPPLVER